MKFKLLIAFISVLFSSTYCNLTEVEGDYVQEISQENSNKGVMYVKGRYLYTSAGEKVILRGVKEMIIWSDNKTGERILPEIAKTGANSVLLVWVSSGKASELDLLIANCISNNMTPMIKLHDTTGDWSKLQTMLDYWKRDDIKAVLNKHKKWVLLNISNQVGNQTSQAVFKNNYITAIRQLRNAGYEMPLVIDAPDWGKDESVISTTWKTLLATDPLQNLLFSFHPFSVENPPERLASFVTNAVNQKIPVVFGAGSQSNGYDCSTLFPYLECIKLCQHKEIGWLAWSWGAVPNVGCGESGSFDITSNGLYGDWNSNSRDKLISMESKYSIQKTSIVPYSLISN